MYCISNWITIHWQVGQDKCAKTTRVASAGYKTYMNVVGKSNCYYAGWTIHEIYSVSKAHQILMYVLYAYFTAASSTQLKSRQPPVGGTKRLSDNTFRKSCRCPFHVSCHSDDECTNSHEVSAEGITHLAKCVSSCCGTRCVYTISQQEEDDTVFNSDERNNWKLGTAE